MTHIDFPLRFDSRGRTASADDASYVRELVELLLFTDPGERVNRPDFGGGVRPLVFAPNGPELAAALNLSILANLQRWLAPLVDVRALEVAAEESTLTIQIRYVVQRTGEVRDELLTRNA
jgi:phage baseplate assembly protein W